MADMIPISLVPSPVEEQDWNRLQLAAGVPAAKIRFWTYETPGVVLGCSQHGLVSAVDAARRAGIALAGRQAGGGAVLTGPWMLSASVLLPATHPLAAGGSMTAYHRIGEAFAAVLREIGIAARAIAPEEVRAAPRNDGLRWACYGGLSPWEVVVGTRKIVGLAQVRRRTGVLLAAGMLLRAPDWPLLCKAIGKPEADAALLAQCNTSCTEQLGWEPALSEIAFGLRRALNEAIHPVLPQAAEPEYAL